MMMHTSKILPQVVALCVFALSGCAPSTAPATSIEQVAEFAPVELDSSEAPSQSMMDHSHIPIAVPDGVAVPSLSILVERDWMSGLNLTLHTQNYALVPPPRGLSMEALMQPSINSDSGFVEGHAHLYINGEKVQRIYGHHVHLPETLFKPGLNQINVSINNHGHMYWTAENRQILATLYVDTNKDDLVVHRFESYPTLKLVDGALCVDETRVQGG